VARRRRARAKDLSAVSRAIADFGAATVVFDAQPIVFDWHGNVARPIVDLCDQVAAAAPTVTNFLIATNAVQLKTGHGTNEAGTIQVEVAARKPWRTAYVRHYPRPFVVVGDQVLTDGLLAWRLGGDFVEWSDPAPMPLWPRWQRRAGALIAPLIFKSHGRAESNE
jgi:hypothetical protein